MRPFTPVSRSYEVRRVQVPKSVMKVEVRCIRSRGRPLPPSERPAAIGRLRIQEDRKHALGRATLCARLENFADPLGGLALPELSDVHLLWLKDRQLRLAGVEHVDGCDFAQTWDVQVVAC